MICINCDLCSTLFLQIETFSKLIFFFSWQRWGDASSGWGWWGWHIQGKDDCLRLLCSGPQRKSWLTNLDDAKLFVVNIQPLWADMQRGAQAAASGRVRSVPGVQSQVRIEVEDNDGQVKDGLIFLATCWWAGRSCGSTRWQMRTRRRWRWRHSKWWPTTLVKILPSLLGEKLKNHVLTSKRF